MTATTTDPDREASARGTRDALVDLHALPPTVPLWPRPTTPDEPAVAPILGIGRSKAYALAAAGEFPVRVLRIGSSYRVTRADLLRYLGETA